MVRHMVQDCLWDDLKYHLTHNLRETHIKDQILQLLWQSAHRLCRTLGLDQFHTFDPSISFDQTP